MPDHLRFLFSAVLMGAALIVLVTGVIGTFRFRYCLNRLHAAAVNDTLGLLLALSSLIVARGLSFVSLKFVLVLILLWIASPVSSHLIAQSEIRSAPDREEHMAEVVLTDEKGGKV